MKIYVYVMRTMCSRWWHVRPLPADRLSDTRTTAVVYRQSLPRQRCFKCQALNVISNFREKRLLLVCDGCRSQTKDNMRKPFLGDYYFHNTLASRNVERHRLRKV
ncbi:hypothetical protein QTP88_002469 [Uroleucon formosanum]